MTPRTGVFGAWGASVSGGSALSRYGDVTEFGFYDLSTSIYLDGGGDRCGGAGMFTAVAVEGCQQQRLAEFGFYDLSTSTCLDGSGGDR